MPSDRPGDGLVRDGKSLSARPLVVWRGAAQRRLCRRSRHTTRVLALRSPQTLSAAGHRLLAATHFGSRRLARVFKGTTSFSGRCPSPDPDPDHIGGEDYDTTDFESEPLMEKL
jgi:hypothetical protein